MAHGAHFLCETRPMIDFQIGHARYVGPFRYLGRRTIFPTQHFARSRDLDIPYTNSRGLSIENIV